MLYILRHGKTKWNEIHKLQGQTDIPLNENGRNMARQAGIEYRDVNFDICFCSPLKRARETAQLVLEGRDIPIIYDDRLKEISFGKYEGYEGLYQKDDTPIGLFFKSPERYVAVEGGESFDELFARTGSFLEEQVNPLLEQGKDVLIVGHGAMNSSIVCQVKNLLLEQFWDMGIDNCKLYQLL